jgi:hypothetical protein
VQLLHLLRQQRRDLRARGAQQRAHLCARAGARACVCACRVGEQQGVVVRRRAGAS